MYDVQYEFSICTVIIQLSFFFDSDIQITITGLGIFDWLLSLVVTWVTDLFHDQIIGLIETQLRQVIEELLPNIDIPFIS